MPDDTLSVEDLSFLGGILCQIAYSHDSSKVWFTYGEKMKLRDTLKKIYNQIDRRMFVEEGGYSNPGCEEGWDRLADMNCETCKLAEAKV